MHSLESFLGTPTVLYFTHNMCHYCTQIIAVPEAHPAALQRRRAGDLTINVWAEGEKLIRRYKEQFGLPFPMLAGKDPQLLRDYEVNYVPIIVFLDRDGGSTHLPSLHLWRRTSIEACRRSSPQTQASLTPDWRCSAAWRAAGRN